MGVLRLHYSIGDIKYFLSDLKQKSLGRFEGIVEIDETYLVILYVCHIFRRLEKEQKTIEKY